MLYWDTSLCLFGLRFQVRLIRAYDVLSLHPGFQRRPPRTRVANPDPIRLLFADDGNVIAADYMPVRVLPICLLAGGNFRVRLGAVDPHRRQFLRTAEPNRLPKPGHVERDHQSKRAILIPRRPRDVR